MAPKDFATKSAIFHSSKSANFTKNFVTNPKFRHLKWASKNFASKNVIFLFVSVVQVGVEIKLRIVRARLISVCHACHRTEQHSKWNCRLKWQNCAMQLHRTSHILQPRYEHYLRRFLPSASLFCKVLISDIWILETQFLSTLCLKKSMWLHFLQ